MMIIITTRRRFRLLLIILAILFLISFAIGIRNAAIGLRELYLAGVEGIRRYSADNGDPLLSAVLSDKGFTDTGSEDDVYPDDNGGSDIVADKIDNKEDPAGKGGMVKDGYDSFYEISLERERARAYEIDLLERVLSLPALSEGNSADEAKKALMKAIDLIEKEKEAESLLKGYGYEKVLVEISDERITVIVKDRELEHKDAERISEIVRRVTGFPEEQTVIAELM